MTVRAGREFLAIPGPTTMPDEVLQAMHRPALDIYSEQMLELTDSLLADLSKLFATKGQSYIYIANGHGAWEAALSNVLSRGDKLLVLESGRFAIGWGNAAAAMGADVEVLKGDWRRAVRPAEVEARLKLDKGEEARPVWLGAATEDRGVGVSKYTAAVTHHIGPDLDAERALLTADLENAGMVDAKYQVTGIGPTIAGHNGGGDLYYTDGEIWVLRLVEACEKREGPAVTIPSPPATALKDQIWRAIANAVGK